ncbi:MAG TPA: EAL domain-containing protein, partial [Dermatophilaceae bacterium]|nr:EAL domain-containing protein [Dermatophilaceae bacterium]
MSVPDMSVPDASVPDVSVPDMSVPATILIVDDEGQNRRLLEALLGHEGYVTRTAESGEAALVAIADEPPDLILLDVMMPGLDGRQVARAVKADAATSKIPIIMVTAQTDREARLAALDAGAEDFLSKPVDRAELWLRVRNLLRLKRLSDLLEKHQVTLEAQAQARTAELQARTVDLRRFRMAMDATDDSIVIVNRTTMRFVALNTTASLMVGYSRDEMLELGPVALSASSRDQLETLYDAIIAGRGRTASIETAQRKDGSTFPVEVHRQAQRAGADWIIVTVARDITDRLKAQSHLEDMAHFDALTGLVNRTLFCETLNRTLAYAAASGERVAVLHVDLDYFKNVNDSHSHAMGDELLIQVSDRLIECVDDRDTVGRLGGDEFALILTMPQGRSDPAVVAKQIQTALARPFRLDGDNVTVTASIGITLHPDDATDTETLLKNADMAMYQAKQSGRDGFQFFTNAMNTEVWRRLELETALRHALKNGEFVLHYQPKVELQGGHVVGLEALLRWERPGFGTVPPSEFIYSLEESGLIVEVGRWVIVAACEQLRDWRRRGIDPVPVSVNISERQLVRGALEGDVLLALDIYEIPARLLELELAENLLMTSADHTITALRNLKAAGVQISIDDFGTGHSSLAYLRRFPVDTLKIDRRFIRDVTHSSDAAATASAIIRMGRSLDLEVVAVGVETAPQLAYLQSHQCDQVQGNLFRPPLAVPALEPLLLARVSLMAPTDQPVA